MEKAGVMIVEDEAVTAMEIKEILEESGYNVLTVTDSGENAIRDAISVQPDIIIMDIMLKGRIDGIEAARKIREFMDIPVIFLTAIESMDNIRIKNTMGSVYLTKPLSIPELLNNIQLSLIRQQDNKKIFQKEKKRNHMDIQAFLSSIVPNLSSNLAITDRGVFLARFHHKFEKQMKNKFLHETGRYQKNLMQELSINEKMLIFLAWIRKYFSNLGFEVSIHTDEDQWTITLTECSWCERNYENIFYCLICQAILKQTFSWSDLPGRLENISDMKLDKVSCKYKIKI